MAYFTAPDRALTPCSLQTFDRGLRSGVPWSPEKSPDLGNVFLTPNALIYSVSFVVSYLVSYAFRMIVTDNRKMKMTIFY
jgi:hypothetical protein